jgi:cation:H+ antiporter
MSPAAVALTSYPRGPGCALEATLLIALLAMLLGLHAVDEIALPFGVGLGTLLLGLAYVGIVMMLRDYDKKQTWMPVEVPETAEPLIGDVVPQALDKVPFSRLVWGFALLALTILVSAAAIAERSGLSTSFVGVTLLASATSLPEVSTTLAAVRIGAYSMAISNIFGSNLLMVALVLPADLAYSGAPILGALDQATGFALISGVLVTAIYLSGRWRRGAEHRLGGSRKSRGRHPACPPTFP